MDEIKRKRLSNLKRMLSPSSVAFIGGRGVSEAIRQCVRGGFSGAIWPVSPKYAELGGITCMPSVGDLPQAPDAAFIAVPREATIEVVRELAERGAGGCVCYASGFAEIGGRGATLQQELVEAAGDMALVGPNCYGVLNYVDGVALWPSGYGGGRVERGVAMISQSGNIALNLTMSRRSTPFAYVLSVGNQAALGIADYIDALVDDPRVDVIGLYIEGLNDIHAFSLASRRARQRGIPLVALKAGRSDLGARLALSHTSSLAGDDRLYSALFERLGVIRVDTLGSLLETLKLFAISGPPPGDRTVILTCSGGDSLLAADAAAKLNLKLPEFSPSQVAELKALLPDFASVSNPFDYNTTLWGDQAALTECFSAVLADGFDTGLLVIDYPKDESPDLPAYDAAVGAFIAAGEKSRAHCVVASTLPELLPARVRGHLFGHRVTALQGVEDALSALSHAALYTRRLAAPGEFDEELVEPPPGPPPARPRLLSEIESKQRLAGHGLVIPRGRLVVASEAAAAAAQLGFPVVVKVASPVIAHKTEAGAVKLSLSNESAVEAAVEELTETVNRLNPGQEAGLFLVEQQITGAVAELIVGVRRDDDFGLALVLGAGGALVELIEDAATLLLPASRQAIARKLGSLRVMKLLTGFRGLPEGDFEAALDAVMAIATFARSHREWLVEIDVNPLLVLPSGRGAVAADALIVLGTSEVERPVSK